MFASSPYIKNNYGSNPPGLDDKPFLKNRSKKHDVYIGFSSAVS